jgi:hypothetical protein
MCKSSLGELLLCDLVRLLVERWKMSGVILHSVGKVGGFAIRVPGVSTVTTQGTRAVAGGS